MAVVPKRFEAARMEDLSRKHFYMVLEYFDDLEANLKAGKGLVLLGPVGIGKTYAMAALTLEVRECVQKKRRFDTEFVTSPDLMDRFGVVDVPNPRKNESYWTTYTTVPWLVINDLGKEYRGGKLEEQVPYKLGRLLRARSEKKLATHITANLLPDRMKETYGESIMSLLREMCSMYGISGKDLRR